MATPPLADTSVWVEALRRGGTTLLGRTERDEPIAYTEPVLMELLAGCRDDLEVQRVRRLLARGPLFRFDPAADFEGAARVYREARQLGVTPASQIDCMVVTIAARTAAPLITLDRQQARIAAMIGVEVLRA